ncbi:hypothetical protein [Candidatus Contubernalis alkaliaceticus]|uniref:hypothetical protein n=1 Tax=Candidatus Contubernalis alkaliaceticus TaxID=338645 RepID=UPI001F4C46F4|nr:hypothetical protein [Candidatus Contubernalis alkalaceticus]UNC93643.1 hypothetical protein HUE98_17080 [Candidatus Contubernalis alkalaceticus]
MQTEKGMEVSKYKKYLLTSLLLILVYISAFIFQVVFISPPPPSEGVEVLYWINNCKEIKEDLILKVEGPKIIFNGGSNTLFNVRTEDITEALGVPTYNLAIHWDLGMHFFIEESKPLLNEGDVIILPLQITHFSTNQKSTKLAFDYYNLYEPDKAGRISYLDRVNFSFQNNPLNYIIDRTLGILSPIEMVMDEGNYSSSDLNQHGDQTNHTGNLLKKASPFPVPNLKETLSLKKLKDFNYWCKENGILLFVTYASMVKFDDYEQEAYLAYFEFLEQYFMENYIKVIGTPWDFMFDIHLFYDHDQHMHQGGMTKNTKKLIQMMKEIDIVGMMTAA